MLPEEDYGELHRLGGETGVPNARTMLSVTAGLIKRRVAS